MDFDCAECMEVVVVNNCFQKRERHRVTYVSR